MFRKKTLSCADEMHQKNYSECMFLFTCRFWYWWKCCTSGHRSFSDQRTEQSYDQHRGLTAFRKVGYNTSQSTHFAALNLLSHCVEKVWYTTYCQRCFISWTNAKLFRFHFRICPVLSTTFTHLLGFLRVTGYINIPSSHFYTRRQFGHFYTGRQF